MDELRNITLSKIYEMTSERRDYFLQAIPVHMVNANQPDLLFAFLTNYNILFGKAENCGMQAVINDFSLFLKTDFCNQKDKVEVIRLLQNTLEISAHIVNKDLSLLSGQLYGRLGNYDDKIICNLLAQAKRSQAGTWLLPITYELLQPGKGLFKIFSGHKEAVSSLTVSFDNSLACSASDNSIKVWEIETGREIQTLVGHKGRVNALAVSPTENLLLSAASDGLVKIWDLDTGYEVGTFGGHMRLGETPSTVNWKAGQATALAAHLGIGSSGKDVVIALSITPDGKIAVSSDNTKRIKVWKIQTCEELLTVEMGASIARAIKVSADGNTVMSGDMNGTISVWDIKTGNIHYSISAHDNWINALALTNDGLVALSGSDDSTIKVWDIKNGQLIRTIKIHKYSVMSLATIPNSNIAISSSSDGTVKMWNINTGEVINTFNGHSSPASIISVTKNGHFVLTGSNDTTVKVWMLDYVSTSKSKEKQKGGISVISPNGRYIASPDINYALQVRDIDNNQETLVLQGHEKEIAKLAIAEDGRLLVSGDFSGIINAWDIETGKLIRTLGENKGAGLSSLAITKNGQIILSCDYKGKGIVWDVRSGDQLHTFQGRQGLSVFQVAVLGDLFFFCGAGEDTVKVWDMHEDREFELSIQPVLNAGGHLVTSLAAMPNRRELLYGLSNGVIARLGIDPGKEPSFFLGHDKTIYSIAVTSDEKLFFSASDDHSLRIWDIDANIEIASYIFDAGVIDVSIKNDGSLIVAYDFSKTEHIFKLMRGEIQ